MNTYLHDSIPLSDTHSWFTCILAFVYYYWYFVLPFANCREFTRRSEVEDVWYVKACLVCEAAELTDDIN